MLKQDLAREIGRFLGIRAQPEWFSGGSKVTSRFQMDIADAVGVPYVGLTKVEHMRWILESVAVAWDARRHSSEESDNPGGNVTKEAYADLLEALESLVDEDQPVRGERLPHEYVQRTIRLRRGQASFRAALLEAYGGECAITGCTAIAVLEAAHIVPFADGGSATADNGLLLRADVHTLFDLRLLTIDPRSHRVIVDPSLDGTEYGALHGVDVLVPRNRVDRPHPSNVQDHFERSGILR
jgi:hypothetical protein